MSAERAVIRLQLTRKAKTALDKLCEAKGMTQIAVMSRTVEFITGVDDVIQAKVLGLMSDESLAPIAKLMWEKMSNGGL